MSRFSWFKNYNRNKSVFTLWVKLKTLADSVDLAGFESCSRNKSALSVKSAREKIEILADWTDFADLKIIIEINLFFTLWVKLKTLADSAGFESCSRNKSALSAK